MYIYKMKDLLFIIGKMIFFLEKCIQLIIKYQNNIHYTQRFSEGFAKSLLYIYNSCIYNSYIYIYIGRNYK